MASAAVLEHTMNSIYAHEPAECVNGFCTLHNRSDHVMRHLPQVYSWFNHRMYRMCKDDVLHPDPDDYIYRLLGPEHLPHTCCNERCCLEFGDTPIIIDEYLEETL